MHLDSTSKKIQAVLDNAESSAPFQIVTGWSDATASAMTGGTSVQDTNGSTPVDIVAAPAASTVRKINTMMIYNGDDAINTITINIDDGGTDYTIIRFTLNIGETLQYTDRSGWSIVSNTGGRLIRTVVLTSGTTHTVDAGCRRIKLRVLAGGGQGGGSNSVAAQSSAGGGGAAGGYAEKTFAVTPNSTYNYSIGAGGTGGGSGANGGAGGNSTFTVGGITVTAIGGPGGINMAAGTSVLSALGGAGPSVSTNGDINCGGMPGAFGQRGSATLACSGSGGNSQFGGAGNGRNTQGAGNAGAAYGSGGGGGCTINGGGATAGGDGSAGIIVVEEYTG